MMTWAEYISQLWCFHGSIWQPGLGGRTMSKRIAKPFHELSHCELICFFNFTALPTISSGTLGTYFQLLFLSRRVHRNAGCCWIAAPSRTSLTKLLFPVSLLHRSEPRLFFSFPAQDNVYHLKTRPNQNGNGSDNYGYEHEVCFSLTASPPLSVCLVST